MSIEHKTQLKLHLIKSLGNTASLQLLIHDLSSAFDALHHTTCMFHSDM